MPGPRYQVPLPGVPLYPSLLFLRFLPIAGLSLSVPGQRDAIWRYPFLNEPVYEQEMSQGREVSAVLFPQTREEAADCTTGPCPEGPEAVPEKGL